MTLSGLSDIGVAQVLSNPELLRLLTSPVGQYMPITGSGSSVIVTRFADVAEVLDNNDSFHVGPIYGPGMTRTVGVFVLGIDVRETWERETRFLRSAVHANDVARIRNLAAEEAQALLRDAGSAGRIDVASGYAHKIALAVVNRYFGVAGPDADNLGRWMRDICWDIFLNVTNRPDVTEAAVRSAGQLNAYLDGEIRRLRAIFDASQEVPDNFLGRLVLNAQEHGIDDAGIRRNIAGLIVGAADTISKTIVHAFDELMGRPSALSQGRKAAIDDDEALVGAYAFEALRFKPHNAILVRQCAKDYVLARGTERETPIAAGSRVYVSIQSAMFDKTVLASPNEFRVDRPWEHYLHFGRGLHRCFGERFNRVVVPQAIEALLRLPGLRRAPGAEGNLKYDGPFPKELVVLYGSHH
jgi:cytochrome P450